MRVIFLHFFVRAFVLSYLVSHLSLFDASGSSVAALLCVRVGSTLAVFLFRAFVFS